MIFVPNFSSALRLKCLLINASMRLTNRIDASETMLEVHSRDRQKREGKFGKDAIYRGNDQPVAASLLPFVILSIPLHPHSPVRPDRTSLRFILNGSWKVARME